MMRKILLHLSLLGFAASSSHAERPNIIFLFSDDHATQAVGAYGSKINKTPHIDSIANDGILFQNTFCANSICAPSRATILTGKHSHQNGQKINQDRFDGSQVTFPKLLQKAGYTTGIFGKWHLESAPTGFDEWKVYPGQGTYYNPVYRTSKGSETIEGYSVETTTDLALDFIERKKGEDAPFLLMCQYKAPHRNWMPGPKYLNLYDDQTIPEPETLFDDYSGRTSSAAKHYMGVDKHLNIYWDLKVDAKPYNKIPKNSAEKMDALMSIMTPEQIKIWDAAYEPKNKLFLEAKLKGKDLVRWKYQRYIKDYLRCVAAVDDNVGRILESISQSGLAENTIVIYGSDQGFYLGEHGWFDKRWMYEESLRMPLMIRWPGKIPKGTVSKELVQNIDYAPTLLEVAGAEVPEAIQGKSLVPLMKNEPVENWRKSIYYHYYQHGGHGVPMHEGVRTDKHKLIHFYHTDEWELYDLDKDPNEVSSEFANPEYAEIRKELEAELKRLKKEFKVTDNE